MVAGGMPQPQGMMETAGNPVGIPGQQKSNTPQLPQVDAANLVNPALQEATTGNVRDFPSFLINRNNVSLCQKHI